MTVKKESKKMTKMLLSINPEHVENIVNGNKKYEYRKVRCRSTVDKIIIYVTSPVMKVIGEVDILDVIEDTPIKVWNMTSEQSGISKEFYYHYFGNKNHAVAYKLGKVIKYDTPLVLSDFGVNAAPQSFVYV